jgi:hypothetical protein
MRPFVEYVSTLRKIVADANSSSAVPASDLIVAALDGQPGRELRRLVPLATRRADGAFFTGSALAKSVVAQFLCRTSSDSIICDPACGAGDLLIAASGRLPVRDDLRATLRLWSKRLRGFDIHEQFVEATRLRLALAAIQRGARARGATPESLAALLDGIRVSNGLLPDFAEVGVVLLNPPYRTRPAPPHCAWGTGLVSDAAVFTHELIDKLSPSTKVVAILPDVLRTGSRYKKWRRRIEQRIQIEAIRVVGIFDNWADVDVFLLAGVNRECIKEEAATANWWSPPITPSRLGDYFDVHVGAVVPHRDPDLGPWRKYLHARTISNFHRFDVSDAPSRRSERTTFRPPFVVVRRTSRPDDQTRAVGTIITGEADVAVENHLIVLSPHGATLDECEKLLEVLQHDSTTQWLNERIRCRHLTVGAVADIPWPNADGSTTPPIRD